MSLWNAYLFPNFTGPVLLDPHLFHHKSQVSFIFYFSHEIMCLKDLPNNGPWFNHLFYPLKYETSVIANQNFWTIWDTVKASNKDIYHLLNFSFSRVREREREGRRECVHIPVCTVILIQVTQNFFPLDFRDLDAPGYKVLHYM